ncbi:MAG TPA: HAD family phosphatase [Caulobacteraceae bacterium]|nr:HAD family phosphatase [Caulobacteraceae bacterium]
MIRGVLWDVGNVIVRWDPRTLYSKIFPDPHERDRFLGEVCTMAWHQAHDAGKPFADNIGELTERHPHHAGAIAAWRERWGEMFSGCIAETEAVMAELHAQGVPQYGLTNMSLEVWDEVQAMSPVFDHFHDVVVSAAERLLKPDPAIFEVVLQRAGLDPHQLLFVDDSAPNIEAARAMGFDVHHFTDPAALRPAIVARGLL